MNKIFMLISVALLSACGSKLDGVYSNNITGVAEQKFSIKFKPDGTTQLTIGSTQFPTEQPYEISGNKLNIAGNDGGLNFTILDNGDLVGEGLRLTKEKPSQAALAPADGSQKNTNISKLTELSIVGIIDSGSDFSSISTSNNKSYSFTNDSEAGKTIFSTCKVSDKCSVTAEIDGDVIQAVKSVSKLQ